MREYGKITPSFWIGRTGRGFRGDSAAQIVAAYLLTAPGSSMIGVYYCPIATIANDTGLDIEGASKGLRRGIEAHFLSFDEVTEWVWVHEMARFQIEASLSPKDKRVVGIGREFEKLPEGPLKQGFYDRYRAAFHLPKWRSETRFEASPFEGASKPHRSQEQEQEQSYPSQGKNLSGKYSVAATSNRRPSLAVVNGPALDDGEGSF